ncbi:FAD-dependent oxidoreductase [candidate division CSSED10-310 bacterium]|uniref:FAD-dependent oxidoreductase n=1 Tax=candidate division CSSED10-310 bacterium TaxID=2855610 RepID=A0ABV6Z0Y4_UNCC1
MIELKSKFIFAPLKTGYGDGSGIITQKHEDFYLRRSKYLGAVTLEPLYLAKGLRELPTQIGIDNENKIENLVKLNTSIQSSGTKVIAHLNHPGRMANPLLPGNYHVSATDKPCENGGATPEKMDEAGMKHAINLFVGSAQRAEKAQFDMIELQFGHGYLLAQYLSPLVNDRADDFGGSFENRTRFPLMVLKAVSEAVSIPLIARISGDEMIPGGITIDEMLEFSNILANNGIQAIHVSAGTVCSSPPWFFQHMFIPKGKTWEMAKKIKRNVTLPIIFVGRINTPEDIEKLEQNYQADYLAIGRALVADPDFLGKHLGFLHERIRPCLACSEGCLGGVKAGTGLQCLVNPLVGQENETLDPVSDPKYFAVIGGGLAGMEAALTLKKRGHTVDLFEKDKLGGQFNLASLPPKKETLKKIVDYYIQELLEYKINVIDREATAEDIKKNDYYDAAILATGSLPAIPPIKGLKDYFWAEVLLEQNLPENKNVVVIGGGLIGIEIAHKLVKKGNNVTVVEMLEGIARGMEMISKKLTLKVLEQSGVKILANSTVKNIEDGSVHIEGKESQILENIDHIILASGMKSYNPLEEKLIGKIPVYVVGDAKVVGKAQDAIASAYNLTKGL